jgi:hypothetical protein
VKAKFAREVLAGGGERLFWWPLDDEDRGVEAPFLRDRQDSLGGARERDGRHRPPPRTAASQEHGAGRSEVTALAAVVDQSESR